MLVEGGERYHLAAAGIPFVSQVDVVDITVLEVVVALHVGGEVEVVIDRRRDLTELGPVDTPSIAEACLVAVVDVPGHVGRREEVTVTVEMAFVAHLGSPGVGNKLHLVVLIAQAGMHVEWSHRQRGHGVGCPEEVVSAVVVDLVDILQQVELVGSAVGRIAEQRGHVHATEARGQLVSGGVVPIEEVAGVVRAGAVLSVDAGLELVCHWPKPKRWLSLACRESICSSSDVHSREMSFW